MAPKVMPVIIPVLAQNASVLEMAKNHFETAKGHFERGEYGLAAQEFQKSYNLSGKANLLYNVALCYEREGDYKKAIAAYQAYLERSPHAPDYEIVKTQAVYLSRKLIEGEPLSNLVKQLWENRGDPKNYRQRLADLFSLRREEFLRSICGLQFDPKALLQILIDFNQMKKVLNVSDKTACLIQGGNICFSSLEFQFSPGQPTEWDAMMGRSDTDYPTFMHQSLPNCKTPKEIIRMLEDVSQSRGRNKKELIEEIAKKYWIDSPEFALAFLRAVESDPPNPNLADEIRRANPLLGPIDAEPLPNLVKKLWENRTKPEIYSPLLDRLHRKRKAFLESICRFKFDPKALLLILLDYHQRYEVESVTDKTACLIQGAKVCFTSLRFQFPRGTRLSALFTGKALRSEYPTMMRQSLAYCRTPEETIQILKDLEKSADRWDKGAAIEEIAKKHWINSPEFALAFIEAGVGISGLGLKDALTKAILLLIPKDGDPPKKLELKDGAILQALHVILEQLPKPDESSARINFLKSLVRERPRWADFFCEHSRPSIDKNKNESCW